jgi:Protein of unknown function (DUF4199)
MKKTVLTYGLISGLISAVLMVATVPFIDKIGFDYGMIVGYTSMLLAFLLVFFGVRSYRETVGDGYISFFKGLGVGLLISLISIICYVITWEIVYYNFVPDFVDKYTNHMIEGLRASGASAAELAQEVQKMEHMKLLYSNPFINAAFTFLEPLPVALLVSFFSALILRKRRPAPPAETDLIRQDAVTG